MKSLEYWFKDKTFSFSVKYRQVIKEFKEFKFLNGCGKVGMKGNEFSF